MNKIKKGYFLAYFFRTLLICLSIGLIFEGTWEILLKKEPLNEWILIAYFLPSVYVGFIKSHEKKLENINIKKEYKFIKEHLKISFNGFIILLSLACCAYFIKEIIL